MLVASGVTVALFAWAGAAAAGADQGLATLLAAGVNVVPAGVFVLGAATLVYGVAPRAAVTTAYAIVAWSFLVELVGASSEASRWLLDLSVLHYLARAPAVAVNWESAAILAAAGIAAAVAGAAAFTRRDLAGA